MLQRTETIVSNTNDTNQNILFALLAFDNLGWNVKYATNTMLVAYTPRKWNKWDDEVTVEVAENEVTVTSKLVHNEAFDLAGKNKKHLRDFKIAFENSKANLPEDKLAELKHRLLILKEKTVRLAEEEIEQSTKLDEAMNISKVNTYITYGIIAANVLMFIITVASGISFMEPRGYEMIPFGANYAPLTAGGEWWRLFTSVFLHFGIIHLAFNMYALYMVGANLEPMIGKAKYLTAYIATGIIASAVSLIWHKDNPVVSAGASGAVFGMYGVFVALLTTNIIPKEVRGRLLQSIGIFVGYNIIYGLKSASGVDNAAHLGGLVSGLLIGYAYYFTKKDGKLRSGGSVVTAVIAVVTAIVIFFSVKNSGNDNTKFELTLQEFAIAEETALKPYANENLSEDEIQNIMMPEWEKARKALAQAENYKLDASRERLRDGLAKYVDLRIKEAELRLKAAQSGSTEYNQEINSLVREIESTIAGLNQEEK